MNKYFWLKLNNDFFDDDTVQFIEEQENGELLVNFYLKLCLKSLKNEGKLIRTVGNTLVPYDDKSLATLTRTSQEVVSAAMELFKRIGLVEVTQDGGIYLTQICEMIGSESSSKEALRKRKQRLNNKQDDETDTEWDTSVTQVGQEVGQTWDKGVTQSGTQVGQEWDTSGTTCGQNVTQSIEYRDKSIDKKENIKEKRFYPPTLEEVTTYCNERNNRVDPNRFIDYYTSKGWMIGKNKMKDWKACVRTWESKDKPSNIPIYDDSNNPSFNNDDYQRMVEELRCHT